MKAWIPSRDSNLVSLGWVPIIGIISLSLLSPCVSDSQLAFKNHYSRCSWKPYLSIFTFHCTPVLLTRFTSLCNSLNTHFLGETWIQVFGAYGSFHKGNNSASFKVTSLFARAQIHSFLPCVVLWHTHTSFFLVPNHYILCLFYVYVFCYSIISNF